MNLFTEIGDAEFVPFLAKLGVDTYDQSFEWMLQDPSFSSVLKWLYNNLDDNNALTAREQYRYTELESKGLVLSPEALEATLSSFQETYPGLCVPGDQDHIEDVEQNISMLEERLSMLDSWDNHLVQCNEEINTKLTLELTHLNAAYQQCQEEQSKAAEECTDLARQLDLLTDEVIDVIAKDIEVYTNCRDDKDLSKRFIVFSPFETYRQSQALFQTQFQVFMSDILKTIDSHVTEREYRAALVEAKALESRLISSAVAYVESKAILRGAQAMLTFLSNYEQIHPSLVRKRLIESRSALELLQEEESQVEQQLRQAAERMGEARTHLITHTLNHNALANRMHINTSLTALTELWHQAMSLDKLLYYCIRHELRTLEELLQFAAQIMDYVQAENSAVSSRIEYMKNIISEQEMAESNRSNLLLRTLFSILGSDVKDEQILIKLYNGLHASVRGLQGNVEECYRNKEEKLLEIKSSSTPLAAYIYDGCTRKANCRDRTVSSLAHTLHGAIETADTRMAATSTAFTKIKNGDKHNLRKLWQWFLADPAKLIAALKKQGAF